MNALPLIVCALFAMPSVAPAVALARPQQKQPVPHFDGWVTDLAHLLPPAEEQALKDRMESFRRGSGHDIALLTLTTLHGDPIEEFGLRVGREWKLGSKAKNDGAILIVVSDDRKMRIEVGRGLEGDLPDAICGRIIDDVLTPHFQNGDFVGGLREGVEALQRSAGGDYAALPPPGRSHPHGGAGFLPIGVILFIIISIAARRRRYGNGGGSVWPWIFVANSMMGSSGRRGGFGDGGFGSGGGSGDSSGGGFSGFGGGGGFSGGGASGQW